MDEPMNSLDGWVAFKPTIFGDKQDAKSKLTHQGKARYTFLVAWNNQEQLLAVTFSEGHRKFSDDKSKSQARTMRYVSK